MITLSICLFLAVFAGANSEELIPTGAAAFTDAPAPTDAPVPTDVPAPTDAPVPTDAPNKPSLKEGDPCDIESINNIKCENDTLRFCDPTRRIAFSPCSVNGRQGFCNCEKTACVAKKPNCGGGGGGVTNCLTPGTKLPDNLDCHKFSYCDEKLETVMKQCPDKLVYDPKTEKCTDRSQARCAKVVCPKGNYALRLIPFPQARNYYVLCSQGVGDVRKCPQDYYAVRNTRALDNACRFDCEMIRQRGAFKDTNLENCRKGIFYICKKFALSFITQEARCPPGMYFNEDEGICTTTDTCG